MNDTMNKFVDAGYAKYGFYAFGMLLIAVLTMSCNATE